MKIKLLLASFIMAFLNISCVFGDKKVSEEQIQEWIQAGDQYHRGQYYSVAFGWYEKAAKAGSAMIVFPAARAAAILIWTCRL